jgi:hypothetical protein
VTSHAASRRLSRSNSKKHCFVVRDHNGQQLAYVSLEFEPRRRSAAKLLERDERGGSREAARPVENT